MRPRWQRTTRRDVYTVDVTAFLSLMVILVPFLLVTAVFSRTTILEIQPIGDAEAQTAAPDPLQLLVTVRQSIIEVSYQGQATPVQISRANDSSALALLAAQAADLKAEHPQSLEATLLLEPEIPYDLLVQVLDVRRVRLQQDGETVRQDALFPLIALGAAPAITQTGRSAP